jgi:hypothetical protein
MQRGIDTEDDFKTPQPDTLKLSSLKDDSDAGTSTRHFGRCANRLA